MLGARPPAESGEDRQLVALADAHLRGDGDLFVALVREHLADHPGHGPAAMSLLGPVDSLGSAILGGFLTGPVLGAVQAWALRAGWRAGMFWALATAAGLAFGLASAPRPSASPPAWRTSSGRARSPGPLSAWPKPSWCGIEPAR